jgi:hypothetical protein
MANDGIAVRLVEMSEPTYGICCLVPSWESR